ncbi:hypothetical protein Poli38472_012721 [Pythium oligandrum]|uniref:Uncharacterized protein n=1 Tax=Pythium oligandrum TaxID=41045 RepID=A0A8K1FFD4_PYTOL|nr:hypothetical protein Poli38472_012721 [Pythium oligandrum]|eukprot:TMW61530.1 hypothetical protein Poli38472_012721 [Pythium oligandrum]
MASMMRCRLAALGLALGAVDALSTQVFNPLWRQDAPVEFDFYVLAQSWLPEFCRGKELEYPGCAAPLDYWRTHFTLHGLWPEFEEGKFPHFCDTTPFDAARIEDAVGLPTLLEVWPNVKANESSPKYARFWEHEWKRHGTCSGLDQVAYFASTVDLVRNGSDSTPTFVQENVNKTVCADELRAAFNMSVVLKCDHGHALAEVYTCWKKDAQHLPTTRFGCPDHILDADTCTHDTVWIPAFP